MDIFQSLIQDIKFNPSSKEEPSAAGSGAGILKSTVAITSNDPKESANVCRKLNGIRVQGSNVPAPIQVSNHSIVKLGLSFTATKSG